MNFAKIKPVDVANGEGVRVSLFVSGCWHRCKGCFNAELWDPNAGQLFTWDTIQSVIDLCKPSYISGLSLLGGEPLDIDNQIDVACLCKAFKQTFPHKDIWCYTGWMYEDVMNLPIMEYIDVLVDGKFVQELTDPRLKFRGSANQRIIDVQKSRETGCVVLRKDLME